MTRTERRTLYLLARHGGKAKQSELSQSMHRTPATERAMALTMLEDLGLISSAATAPGKRGGVGGTVYWLTETGKAVVADEVAAGRMQRVGTADASA